METWHHHHPSFRPYFTHVKVSTRVRSLSVEQAHASLTFPYLSYTQPCPSPTPHTFLTSPHLWFETPNPESNWAMHTPIWLASFHSHLTWIIFTSNLLHPPCTSFTYTMPLSYTLVPPMISPHWIWTPTLKIEPHKHAIPICFCPFIHTSLEQLLQATYPKTYTLCYIAMSYKSKTPLPLFQSPHITYTQPKSKLVTKKERKCVVNWCLRQTLPFFSTQNWCSALMLLFFFFLFSHFPFSVA